MLRTTLQLLVALIGVLAFGLAWLSHEQRAAIVLFGGIGLVCVTLVGTSFFVSSRWLTWTLLIVAALGVLAGVGGVVVAIAITRGYNSMVVRDVDTGQSFSLNGGARVARVGSLILRYQKTEPLDDGSLSVTLTATILQTQNASTEIVLRKPAGQPGTETLIGNHYVKLLDVTKLGNKTSLYSVALVVAEAKHRK